LRSFDYDRAPAAVLRSRVELSEAAMKKWISHIAAAPLALAASTAHATPLPPPVAAMIEAAADDPEALKAVVKAAKKTNPDSLAEIDAQAAASTKRAAAEKARLASNAGFFRGWSGEVELGGSISTGNTDEQSFAGGVELEKETPKWARDLGISVDRKRESGEKTKDRYFLAYSSQLKLSPRLYAVGVLWGERDPFAGYDYRFSESLGLGYRLVDRTGLKLRVEAGPALRQAGYLSNDYESTLAARGAAYLTWNLGPRLRYTQSLVTYLETKNSTLLAASALTTKLQGAVSARASYEVRHEADPPQGRQKTDTTTRMTFVFGF
jgi:putative salt-induced outer membrane protein